MMIGMQTCGNTFVGIAATIQLGGNGSLTLANIKGLSLDGAFRLSFVYDVAPKPGGSGNVVNGTVASWGKLPKGTPISGPYSDLAAMGVNDNLSGDYFFIFNSFGDATTQWGAMLIGNLPGTLTILPSILTTMGGPDITSLMPTLKWLVGLVNPFMQRHPLIIAMPMDSFYVLMPLMM
jgi:hypothetical protein